MRHFHRFGPWLVHKSGEHEALPDKEYTRATWAPPTWVQNCECGQENRLRSRERPRASLKFKEIWGSKRW